MGNPELEQLLQAEKQESPLVGRIRSMRALIWNRKYLGLVLAGACFNALRYVCSKIVVTSLHPVLISFAERVMMVMCSAPPILYHQHSLRTSPLAAALLATTGLLSAIQIILVMVSYQFLYVADASVIISCNPVLIAIFGWLFLKEKVTWTDICACVFVLIGIVALSRPTQMLDQQISTDSGLLLGAFAAVGAAVAIAAGAIFKRIICLMKVEVQVIIFLTNLVSMLICAVTCSILGIWEVPSSHIVQGLLLGSGCLGYVGNLTMIVALLHENAYHVSLVGTFQMLLVYILQFIVLSVPPDTYSLLGAGGVTLGIILAAIRKKTVQDEEDEKEAGTMAESGEK